MAIFRTNKAPLPSTPPQDNIERGDEVVIPGNTAAPRNLVPPSLGSFTSVPVGTVLTVQRGVWQDAGALDVTGGFFRNGVAIAGAGNVSYVTTSADDAANITYQESAVNAGGQTVAVSNSVLVEGSTGAKPTVVAIPVLTAYRFQEGHEITATIGTFTDADSVTHYWTANNVVLPGAGSSNKYTPGPLDVGKVLRFITRGTNIHGSTEAISAPTTAIETVDLTPVPTEVLFNFTDAVFPAGVTVARASANGTYVDSDLQLKEAAADTPRIHHDSSGNKLGLYVERARTNLVANGKNPMGTGWGTVGTATRTANVQPDVMGATGAGRLQIPSMAGYNGARYQLIHPAMSLALVQYYARTINNTGFGMMLGSQSGAVLNPQWTRHDVLVVPGTNFQIDLIANSNTLLDAAFFAVGFYENGQIGDSPILTTGATATRAKETVTFTGPITNAFYDIRVTFADGSSQDFTNEAVGGTWVLDAEDLVVAANKNIVKSVGFYALGALPGAPSPAPPAPPPADPKDLGITTLIGDDQVSGSALNASIAEAVRTRFGNAGFSMLYVGTSATLSTPGGFPVSGEAGWDLADLNTDRPNVVAHNPRTIIVMVRPNDLTSMAAGIITYLNNLVTDLGGLTNRRIIVCGPYSNPAHNPTTLNSMKTAMQQWAAGGANRYYVNLDNADLLQPVDYAADGILLSATGANKVAGVIVSALQQVIIVTPPPPPPPAGGIMDDATFDEMMLYSTNMLNTRVNNGNSRYRWSNSTSRYEGNEGFIEGVGYNVSGWRNGPERLMGYVFRKYEQPNAYFGNTKPTNGFGDLIYSNYMDPWMVFCHEQGKSGGQGHAYVRNFRLQFLMDDNKWYWATKNGKTKFWEIGWAPDWRMGPGNGQGYPNPDPPGDRPVTKDFTNQVSSITIAGGKDSSGAGMASHFTFSDFQFTFVDARRVRGWVLSAEVMRGEKSSPSHQGLLHIGLDPKYPSGPADSGLYWDGGYYPNAGISRTIKLTTNWRRIYASSIQAEGEAGLRLTPLTSILANRPMNPW